MNIVYSMTHHVYDWILPSMRSLAERHPGAKVYILAEDDLLPFDLPMDAQIINVTGQTFFPKSGVNYNTPFKYINLLKVCYAEILPVDKVIHLDIDTVINDDLTPLWDMDLTGKWFAACPEYKGKYRPFGDLYYNAGVMVLNLAQMRSDGICERMVDYLNTVEGPWADQDAWNYFALAEGKALPIDIRYNECFATGETDHPAVVHYCGIRDWWTDQRMRRREYLEKYRQ